MNKSWKSLVAVAVAAAVSGSSALGAVTNETLGGDTRTLIVTYKKGAKEKYVVQWTASMTVDHYESGSPAIPLQGKFIDTRQCHWAIDASVTRRVYLANQNGELFERKDLATPFASKHMNQGAPFQVHTLQGENCNRAHSRYLSDLNDSRLALRRDLPEIVKNDLPKVVSVMKSAPNVKQVQ